MMATIPAQADITAIAQRLAAALGGVNVRGKDVALSVDAAFPDLTDEEFASIRPACEQAADSIRAAAMSAMWGERE